MKTKPTGEIISVDAGANDLRVTFYISDSASGNIPRVVGHLQRNEQVVINVDRPLTDFTDLTNPQKVILRSLLLAIRDQLLTLEGFV